MDVRVKLWGRLISCLLFLQGSVVYAQLGTPSPFQIIQPIDLDTVFQADPGGAVLYPGLPISKRAVTQLSYHRLMDLRNWQRLSFTAKRQFQATSSFLQLTVEKLPAAVSSSQLTIQFSRFLQHNYAVGLQLGILRKSYQLYHSYSTPFAQVGCWTKFSPTFFHAISLGFSMREVATGWKQTPYILLARSITSVQVGRVATFQLQLEKASQYSLFWQAGVSIIGSKSISFRFLYSSAPQWWVIHFLFPVRKILVNLSLGFQPLLGTISGFTTTWSK